MEDGYTRLLESMVQLTEKYEATLSNYSLDHLDSSYLAALSKGVVGFTVSIDKIEGKAKLSQNHPQERVIQVVEELEKTGKSNKQQIANLMRKKSLRVF